MKVWDVRTGQELLNLEERLTSSVAWSPDGQRLASGSYRTVKVLEARTGKELLTIKGHTDHVSSVAWSPDGKRIVSASTEFDPGGNGSGEVKVWEARTGQELLNLKHTHGVHSVAWSPDGRAPGQLP